MRAYSKIIFVCILSSLLIPAGTLQKLKKHTYKDESWESRRDEVERRLMAAQVAANDLESKMIREQSQQEWNPLKHASQYWFKEERDKEPKDPYVIAITKVRKIEKERVDLYHRYNKETPEEKLGGGLAMLIVPLMIGAAAEAGEGVGVSGRAGAALKTLGKAESALAVGSNARALTSITKARGLLSTTGETQALTAVGKARTALVAGEIVETSTAIRAAQNALAPRIPILPIPPIVPNSITSEGSPLSSLNGANSKIFRLKKSDTWYTNISGEKIQWSSGYGFAIFLPNKPNPFGGLGLVVRYPDSKFKNRNTWISFDQSQFSVYIDSSGHVYGTTN